MEIPAVTAGSSPPWPVAAMAPGSWLVLDASCADDQVGLFVAALAARIEVQPPGSRDEVVNALLADELLIAPGGLQVRDSTTATVVDARLLCRAGGLARLGAGGERRLPVAGT